MYEFVSKWCALFLLALPLAAQGEMGGDPAELPRPAAKMSVEGREALAQCRESAKAAKRVRGKERAEVLQNAASAYDRVAGGFVGEPVVAARAAYEAAELWRRHGSLPLAEKDYLLAAKTDEGTFGQRGWIGAADMQRRMKRLDDALASYRKAITFAPGSAHAQRARLELARLMRDKDRLDDAVALAQVALESARPGRQTIDAADLLAMLWIAKGDLDAAGRALGHAEKAIEGLDNGDPVVAERLRKAVLLMPARRALQRALDEKNDAAGDAVRLDAARRDR